MQWLYQKEATGMESSKMYCGPSRVISKGSYGHGEFNADVALTSAGPQTTPCHGGQYRVHQGNMRNFGPTNNHGTASEPMQWLYQKEATGMESSKFVLY